MTELTLRVQVRRGPEGLLTSLQVENEGGLEAFGPWRGLPEALSGLVHCALLLESRMQLMRLVEEGRSIAEPELSAKVEQMLGTQIKALLPQAIQRSLAEFQRIQDSR